jgi:hypothetical protein
VQLIYVHVEKFYDTNIANFNAFSPPYFLQNTCNYTGITYVAKVYSDELGILQGKILGNEEIISKDHAIEALFVSLI